MMDLTSSARVTTALLDDPLAWRIRVVERIDIDSAGDAAHQRSVQCAPLRPLISAAAEADALPLGSDAEAALIVMPIAPVPRGPLLDLDIEGPDGSSAFLLPRGDIAAREMHFISNLIETAGLQSSFPARAIVEAALGFTEGPWQTFAPYRADGLHEALRRYLAAGTDLNPEDPVIERWIQASMSAGVLLGPFADVRRGTSAMEVPAVVVPVLFPDGGLSQNQITEGLEDYCTLLQAATTSALRSEANAASDLLSSLADYGRHYDLMAVVRVPLDEPFVLKSSDRRPLDLSVFTNTGRQDIVVADARSNHVTLRVTDPNARLSRVEAFEPERNEYAYGATTARRTTQVHSFYAYEPERTYRVALQFRVAVLRRLQLVPYGLSAVFLLATALIIWRRPHLQTLTPLLTGGAVAASVLLTRETSSLGSRLRRASTLALITSAACLAVTVMVLLYRA